MQLFRKPGDYEAFERAIEQTLETCPRVVSGVQPKSQLEQIRQSVRRGQPYGSGTWTQRTATELDLQSTLRPRGRPRKVESPDN